MTAKPKPKLLQPVDPERRANPRGERPAIPANERKLGKGWWLTVDSWPREMFWPISRPRRYANNPRKNVEAVRDVITSLTEFGMRQPLVVDGDGEIIVGDTRLLGCIQLGWPRVPVHVALGFTPEQIRAYRIADNKTGERAEWDIGRLGLEFAALTAANFDTTLTGFHVDEIAALGVDPMSVGDAFGALPNGAKAPFEQMAFQLHSTQAEVVREALDLAKAIGPFDGPNENSNGNALTRVMEYALPALRQAVEVDA